MFPETFGDLSREVELCDSKMAEDIARMSPTARDEGVGDSDNRVGERAEILWLLGSKDAQSLAGDAANCALASLWGKMSQIEEK